MTEVKRYTYHPRTFKLDGVYHLSVDTDFVTSCDYEAVCKENERLKNQLATAMCLLRAAEDAPLWRGGCQWYEDVRNFISSIDSQNIEALMDAIHAAPDGVPFTPELIQQIECTLPNVDSLVKKAPEKGSQ